MRGPRFMKRNRPTNIRTERGKELRRRNQSLPYHEITAPRYSDGSCPKLRLSLHLPTVCTHPSSHFSLAGQGGQKQNETPHKGRCPRVTTGHLSTQESAHTKQGNPSTEPDQSLRNRASRPAISSLLSAGTGGLSV